MRHLTCGTVLLTCVSILPWPDRPVVAASSPDEPRRPVALLGSKASTTALTQRVLLPSNIRHEVLGKWLSPAEYHRFAVIYFAETLRSVEGLTPNMWSNPKLLAIVQDYVRSGGVIVITGAVVTELAKGRELSAISSVLGLGHFGGSGRSNAKIQVAHRDAAVTTHLARDAYDWHGWSLNVGKLTTATVLAEQLDATGKVVSPFVTVNAIGKGRVYWFSAPLFRLHYRREPTEEADEQGRLVLTPRGKDVEAYRLMLLKAIETARPARGNLEWEHWDPTPLGELVPLSRAEVSPLPAEGLDEPVPSSKGDSVLLSERGQARILIVTSDKPTRAEAHLAGVIEEHLEAMSGADLTVQRTSALGELRHSHGGVVPADAKWRGFSFIAVGSDPLGRSFRVALDDLGAEGFVLKTTGNVVIVAGKDDLGLRHATYSFLEALGCRYLWPGELGKVIPRRETLRVPPLDIRDAPRLWSRHIRNRSPHSSARMQRGFKKLGIDPDEYGRRFFAALKGVPADDGWFAWHRMGSHKTVARGHSFGDYWHRFGKEHPEWFALQPNGVRDQSLSTTRPRLCHSNRRLIEQVIADRLQVLRENPKVPGVPVGLNDGGYTTFCLCQSCRRLDPANGRPIKLLDCTRIPRRYFEYVSLTDRVLWFTNQIAEGVAKEFPDKQLGLYAYSVYNAPPLKTKPHPNLVIFYVGASLDDWNGWTRFGNKIFYRPNVLLAHRRKTAPQNFSRTLFNNFRHMYRTGLIGTDFDSCQHQWALKGLVYYVLTKAHWNPTQLDYEALVEDYCRSGFGAAAKPVRRYFAILEQLSNQAAEEKVGIVEAYNGERLQKLQACLDEAKGIAAGVEDKKIPWRVEFLMLGLELAKAQVKLASNPEDDGVKQEIRDLLRRIYEDNLLAVNVPLVATYGRF